MNFSVPPFLGSAALAQAATPSRRAPIRATEPTRQGSSLGRPRMARLLALKGDDAQLSTNPCSRAAQALHTLGLRPATANESCLAREKSPRLSHRRRGKTNGIFAPRRRRERALWSTL